MGVLQRCTGGLDFLFVKPPGAVGIEKFERTQHICLVLVGVLVHTCHGKETWAIKFRRRIP